MRKLDGVMTPCQSNAAAMRFRRSLPAATEGRHHQHRHQGAQRIRIARRDPRHRHAGLERLGRAQRAQHVRAPERRREGILGGRRDLVGHRGRRPVRPPAVAIEPPQRHPARSERAASATARTPPRPAGRTRRDRSHARSAAARARDQATTPRGTSRSRSRCRPAPATAAPRRSTSAPATALATARRCRRAPAASRRAVRCPWGDRSSLSPERESA